MSGPLARVRDLLHQRCGLYFEGVAEAKLAEAVEKRRQQCRLAQLSEYFERLCSNDSEFQALLSLLTINESYFFREPEQLRFILNTLLPRRLQTAAALNKRPLRVLSAGCASGEEPYSLAIALAERYGPNWYRDVQIHAGDVDRAILARARAGCFNAYSFRSDWPLARERHFLDRDGCWEIGVGLREHVHFAELNLVDPQPAAHWVDFDLILCRNVLIYFDQPTRTKILHKLSAMLRDQGSLIVGSAETLSNDLGVLPLVEESGQFYFLKANSSTPDFLFPETTRWSEPGTHASTAAVQSGQHAAEHPVRPVDPIPNLGFPGDHCALTPVSDNSPVPECPSLPSDRKRPGISEPTKFPENAPDAEALRAMVIDGQYEQAVPWLRRRLAVAPDDTTSLLQLAYLELNRQHWQAAIDAAQRVVDTDSWNADALLLLGLTAKGMQQHEQAIGHLRRIVYTQPGCWTAHFYLGHLYREQGLFELAARAYRRALQLLSSQPLVNPRLKVIPHILSASEVRFLCEHQLQSMGPALEKDRQTSASTRR